MPGFSGGWVARGEFAMIRNKTARSAVISVSSDWLGNLDAEIEVSGDFTSRGREAKFGGRPLVRWTPAQLTMRPLPADLTSYCIAN